MPWCAKPRGPEAGRGAAPRGRLRRWLLVLLLACGLAAALPAAALARTEPTAHGVRVDELRVDLTADGVFLYAQLRLDLSESIRSALRSGIPIYFVMSANIVRTRWWWWDDRVASVARYMRVAYQPLTRQWRVSMSSSPVAAEGLGVGLTRFFDSLADALATIQNVGGWQIASGDAMAGAGSYHLDFDFRLDAKRLPRTFLLGDLGERDWHLEVHREMALTPGAAR